MACGCRRKRLKTIPGNNPQTSTRITIKGSEISRRKKKCSKCKYSTKVKSRSMGQIRKCKKANRMIANIIRDINFKCPIEKF